MTDINTNDFQDYCLLYLNAIYLPKYTNSTVLFILATNFCDSSDYSECNKTNPFSCNYKIQ